MEVVVDPTINEEMMEMYADQESRGGILEPPGICEVKFRKADQIKTMHRLDEELMEMDQKLADASLDFAEVTAKMQSMAGSADWDDDKAITAWLKDDAAKIADTVAAMKADGVAASVEQMLSSLPADARADLVK